MEKSNEFAVVYMMLGLPGAGKTFFARQYAAEAGLPLIDIERLRHELFEEPGYSPSEDKVVINLADYMIEQFLSAGLSVVIDGMNDTRVRRHSLREMARQYKAHPIVIWVQTDVNTAFNRASHRDRRNPYDKYAMELDNDDFERRASHVKLPQHEDYIVISGKHVFRNQLNVVRRKVEAMKTHERVAKNTALGGRVNIARRQSSRPRVQ